MVVPAGGSLSISQRDISVETVELSLHHLTLPDGTSFCAMCWEVFSYVEEINSISITIWCVKACFRVCYTLICGAVSDVYDIIKHFVVVEGNKKPYFLVAGVSLTV